MKYFIYWLIPFFLVVFSGCTKSPENQCLDSFRETLKNPDSGKVVSFSKNILTYTATNSYGDRVQKKAICIKDSNKWIRNTTEETRLAIAHSTTLIERQTTCLKNSEEMAVCDEVAPAIRRAGHLPGSNSIDIDKLISESRLELGFD